MAGQLQYGDPNEVGMRAEGVARAARVAERWVAEDHAPGLVVLVARRNRIILHQAYGTLTPEIGAPALPTDAIFPIASIDKTITATAIMCLVEDGLVGLNRPVQEYIPDFVGKGKEQVTLYHLLTHTSGFRDDEAMAYEDRQKQTVKVPIPDANQYPANAEHLFFWYGAPLWKPPGTEMSYCSVSFCMLDEIIRRVSGRASADFVSERIFQPLGMKDTSYGLPGASRSRLALRYRKGSDTPTNAYAAVYETPEGQDDPWNVFSTAVDMATLGQMYLQRGSYGDARVLSAASVATMTRNQIPGIALTFDDEFFPEATWGLGWNIQGEKRLRRGPSLSSKQTFGHNGWGGVYLWVDPVNEIVGVWFALQQTGASGILPDWNGDLFVNAVTAAVDK